jgi:DNA modification methylase
VSLDGTETVKERVEHLVDKYYVADARRIAELLPGGGYVDVTITSPPYWNLKDYGVDDQIGFGQSYDVYLDDLECVFRAVYDLTRSRGSLWIISDTIKHKGEIRLLPFDLARRLRKIGWILQDIVIWNKDRTLPWSHEGKLRNIFEYITFYSKEPKFNYHLDRVRDVTELKHWWVRYPERYSPKGKAPARTWSIPIPRQGSWGNNWVRHFNPLPPELVERMLLLTTNRGAVVLDPFCGSGAVLAQAHVMGRRYVGLDLNASYKDMFESQVLPGIRSLHKRDAGRSGDLQRRKRVFAKRIRALRQTKYPREIVRLYGSAFGDLHIKAILALRQSGERPCLNVVFVFPNGRQPPEGFLPKAKKLCARPPLSKYGLEVLISAYAADVVSAALLKEMGLRLKDRLYVYANGRTYSWAESLTASDWLSRLRGGASEPSTTESYPPIVSDIGVRVDPRRPSLEGRG